LGNRSGSDKREKEKKMASKVSPAGWDFTSPDLSRTFSGTSARMLFPSPIRQSEACLQVELAEMLYTNSEDIYCTFAIL